MKILFFYVFLYCILLSDLTQEIKTQNGNKFKTYIFDDSDAKCLDGSPYGVGYSPGYSTGNNKVIIYINGGAWCEGRNKDAFYKSCLQRSKTHLGSSKNWRREYYREGGFIGGDPKKNINFYNWHRFDFSYCDGSGNQGHITNPVNVGGETLYFRGNINFIEGLNFVFSKLPIKDIDTLVLTGLSAGGLATFYWIQFLADYVHHFNKNVKVYGIPVSGFFVNFVNKNTKDNDFMIKKKILYEEVNREVVPFNKDCIRDNVLELHNCLMSENLIKYIKVPFLIIESGYDNWQLENILGLDCLYNYNLRPCNEQNKNLAHEFKNYQTKLIEREVLINKNLSVWSPSCVTHTITEGIYMSPKWEVPQDSGNTINNLVKEFLEKEGKKQFVLLDKIDWPNNEKCA